MRTQVTDHMEEMEKKSREILRTDQIHEIPPHNVNICRFINWSLSNSPMYLLHHNMLLLAMVMVILKKILKV